MSIELDRVGWEDGTLVSPAKVNVGGTVYEVEPEVVTGTTPTSAENLKKMEDNAENAINEGILDANTYSTTEKRIGTWIDGKPLYKKVIEFGALPNATTKRVNHGISDIKNVVSATGIAKRYVPSTQTYHWQPLPLVYQGTSSSFNASVGVSSTQVSVACDNDRSDFTESYIYLEYTKTTD